MNISGQLQNVWNNLPQQTRLVAVSKFHSPEIIMEAYEAGQKIFGESKVQELFEKYELLPKDIEWHFIGHLQTNKIKYILPFVNLIHAVDSEKLFLEINKEARKTGRKINVLLQIHIAKEETKFGFTEEECLNFLEKGTYKSCSNVEICGLMGMATFTDNESQIRSEFRKIALFFNELKHGFFKSCDSFKELSLGMSDDYLIAIEEGSTLVRVGSKIFGERGFI